MAKRSSKFNLGYFCSVKNIVPIILVVIIVFLVFNILQNNSFNPFIEGNDNLKQTITEMSNKFGDMSGNINDLKDEIGIHTNPHKDNDHNHTDDGIISELTTLQNTLPDFDDLKNQISSLKSHATNNTKHT